MGSYINKVLVCILILLSAGCAGFPTTGSIIHTKVIGVISLEEYRRVKEGRTYTPIIYDAIEQGVTEEDVRSGRLIFLRCSPMTDGWAYFYALSPPDMLLKRGDFVQVEAGDRGRHPNKYVLLNKYYTRASTLSRVIRQIPPPTQKEMNSTQGSYVIKCEL